MCEAAEQPRSRHGRAVSCRAFSPIMGRINGASGTLLVALAGLLPVMRGQGSCCDPNLIPVEACDAGTCVGPNTNTQFADGECRSSRCVAPGSWCTAACTKGFAASGGSRDSQAHPGPLGFHCGPGGVWAQPLPLVCTENVCDRAVAPLVLPENAEWVSGGDTECRRHLAGDGVWDNGTVCEMRCKTGFSKRRSKIRHFPPVFLVFLHDSSLFFLRFDSKSCDQRR